MFNYTFACDFRGLISKIIGCTSTPALKMPIMHLPWLYLFKCVSMFLFHTLLLQLLHHAQCRISLSYLLLKIQDPSFTKSDCFSAINYVSVWLIEESCHRKISGAFCRSLKQHMFQYLTLLSCEICGESEICCLKDWAVFLELRNVWAHIGTQLCICVICVCVRPPRLFHYPPPCFFFPFCSAQRSCGVISLNILYVCT